MEIKEYTNPFGLFEGEWFWVTVKDDPKDTIPRLEQYAAEHDGFSLAEFCTVLNIPQPRIRYLHAPANKWLMKHVDELAYWGYSADESNIRWIGNKDMQQFLLPEPKPRKVAANA